MITRRTFLFLKTFGSRSYFEIAVYDCRKYASFSRSIWLHTPSYAAYLFFSSSFIFLSKSSRLSPMAFQSLLCDEDLKLS